MELSKTLRAVCEFTPLTPRAPLPANAAAAAAALPAKPQAPAKPESPAEQPAAETDAAPAAEPAPAPGNFTVELRRSSARERWGFIWEAKKMEQSNLRVVEKVSPGSLAATWNGENPGREVLKGDVLVKVNGVGGSMEALTMELSKTLRAVCEFTPRTPRAPLPANAEAAAAALPAKPQAPAKPESPAEQPAAETDAAPAAEPAPA